MSFVSLIYNIFFVPLGLLIVFIMKPFNKKLKERQSQWRNSLSALDKLDNSRPSLWFHSASMGEFEQAKPVIEEIKKMEPDVQIVVSFFSPSGYINQQQYSYADAIIYLPFDTRANAKMLISKIKPRAVAFVRYEIWRNYIEQLYNKQIPVYLICATVPGSNALRTFPFFKSFSKSSYSFFTKIFTIGDYHSKFFIDLIGLEKVETMTDTRFDRIIQNVARSQKNPIIPREIFQDEDFVLVVGSSWKPDEDIVIDTVYEFYKKNRLNIRLVIVPHEPEATNINRIRAKLPNSLLLSELLKQLENLNIKEIKENLNGKHIIVDSVGKLLQLYSIATAAYIGGGFGVGIHSVTEPAGYGLPLCTGPGIENSYDARELLKLKVLTTIENKQDFTQWIKKMNSDKELLKLSGKTAKEYVYNLTGSSKILAKALLNR